MLLYCTADTVGMESGGGKVTQHEYKALSSLGNTLLFDRDYLTSRSTYRPPRDPWDWDNVALQNLPDDRGMKLAHFYSGTFTDTVRYIRRNGTKVVYTIAAHSIEASKREHEKYGINYESSYPHLCQRPLWDRYSGGYFDTDVIVVPSNHSKEVVLGQAGRRPINVEVIPHGCNLPDEITPVPKDFVVGYLGAVGPDKGLRYLIEAWKKLNYLSSMLIIAGRESTGPFVRSVIDQIGGGNIRLMGWVDGISDFYSQISLYVQPSVTEGFGIEVLEAMAHGRPVLCSEGAGAKDLVDREFQFPPGNPDRLAEAIDMVRGMHSDQVNNWSKHNRRVAENYTWDKIQQKYVDLWKGLLV